MNKARFDITPNKLILSVAVFIGIAHNLTFIETLRNTFSGMGNFWLIIASVTIIHICVLTLLLSLSGPRAVMKPILMAIVIASALTAYFIDTYHVIINDDMINNMMKTDSAEARDLINLRLTGYLALLGLLPALFIYRAKIIADGWLPSTVRRLGLVIAALAVAGATIYVSSDFFASFFRAHKSVRYYTNPTTPIYSLAKYAGDKLRGGVPDKLEIIDPNADVPESDLHKELVVLVVGETARWDHFSLNGYERTTNPLLAQEDVVSFTQVSSCGTSTAVSVPCMFSFMNRDDFSGNRFSASENILDVLVRASVRVVWRDNNSSSKGVADRVEYQSFRSPDVNTVCDEECRDEGMLVGLDEWIEKQPRSDMLIVLHQMGSHGPAYYKRYPKEFEVFKPTCQSSQLNDCDPETIVNAYDNTIVYTDYFLHKLIQWLKTKAPRYETSMLYFSDHGESLGEAGLYLHGFPYSLAPESQTHVPAILWSSKQNPDIDSDAVRKVKDAPLSHDNLFHTLLGLFEISSEVYQPDKDLLRYQYRYQ